MAGRSLAAVVAVLSLTGCFDLLGDPHSDRGGTFPLHDGVLLQVHVKQGDETNWTWSSERPVGFTVAEAWTDGDREETRMELNVSSTSHAGRSTASRTSSLLFSWSNPSPGEMVNVTYFIRTEGYHQVIHY